VVGAGPEIRHGLGNLIDNAADFAAHRVEIAVTTTATDTTVVIADDGPGFAHTILGDLGEPYVSTRRQGGGMGLGLFIAKTLLERTGAQVRFRNAATAGAEVVIRWPRDILDASGSSP